VIGASRIVRGDPLLQEYIQAGGIMGGVASAGLDQTKMDESIPKLISLGYGVNKFTSLSDFFRYFQQTLEYSETATRIQMYKLAKDRAISQGLTENEAIEEAVFYANDYVNYSRSGLLTEPIKKMITFWNASIQGLDRFRKTLAASGDYGSAFAPYLKYKMGKGAKLTQGEYNQLHQSFFAWAYFVGFIGSISAIIHMLWGDDDRLRDIDDQQRIKSSHWIIPVGETQLARIPKPFESGFIANFIERWLWERQKGDPEWASKYMDDILGTTLPPMRPAWLDYWDIFQNRVDPLSRKPLESRQLRDLAPEDRYTPYTSELAKSIAEKTGGSPVVIDAALKRLGTSWARDILGLNVPGLPWYNPNKPEMSLDQYAVARRFLWSAGKGSEKGRIVREMMGMEDIVGGLFSFYTPPYSQLDMRAKTYANRLKQATPDAANAALRDMRPRERGYAILMTGLSGRSSKFEKLDPMNRAWAIGDAAYNIQRELSSGTLILDKGSKKEGRMGVNAVTSRRAMDILTQIQLQEYGNGLTLTKEPGYANNAIVDVSGLYEELKAADPDVYKELKRRMDKANVLPFAGIQAVWPELQRRLESDELYKDAQRGQPEKVEGYIRDLWFKAKYPIN
jgi:hypothetical protein